MRQTIFTSLFLVGRTDPPPAWTILYVKMFCSECHGYQKMRSFTACEATSSSALQSAVSSWCSLTPMAINMIHLQVHLSQQN